MKPSKQNSGRVVLEDFGHWVLSLIGWKHEGGKSHAIAFEIGLTLDGSEYMYWDTKLAM